MDHLPVQIIFAVYLAVVEWIGNFLPATNFARSIIELSTRGGWSCRLSQVHNAQKVTKKIRFGRKSMKTWSKSFFLNISGIYNTDLAFFFKISELLNSRSFTVLVEINMGLKELKSQFDFLAHCEVYKCWLFDHTKILTDFLVENR